MEEVFQDQAQYDQNERDEAQQVIQAKKEKFRVKIRQTKTKQIMQAKRMKLMNGIGHTPNQMINNEQNGNQDSKSGQEQIIAKQLLQDNINMLLQMGQYNKDQLLQSLDFIIGYLIGGAYHEDVQQLTQISGCLNYLLKMGQQFNSDLKDMKLFKSSLITILNITYYCDQAQIKFFSNPEMMDSILKLMFSEDIQIREYCLTTINNIIQEDQDAIKILQEHFMAQQIISLVTTYAMSNEIVFDLASIIKQIIQNDKIPYSQASEFLVPIDEIVEYYLQQGLNIEEDNVSLSELYESVYLILNKEERDEIYESFVLEFPNLITHMFENIKAIDNSQKCNGIATNVCQIVGLLLSGNVCTTQILLDNGVFECLKKLINHPLKKIRKQAVWSCSNLFVYSQVKGIRECLTDLLFWDPMIQIAFTDSKFISKWAYVTILNGLILNDNEYTELIIDRFPEQDIIKFVFNKLEDELYSDVTTSLLEALRSLIGYGDQCQKKYEYSENHIIAQIQRINSKPILEQCQTSLEEEVSTISSNLLDQLF